MIKVPKRKNDKDLGRFLASCINSWQEKNSLDRRDLIDALILLGAHAFTETHKKVSLPSSFEQIDSFCNILKHFVSRIHEHG